MTSAPKPAAKPAKANPGERIAKVLARAGIASRREAERMIELGQIAVNGKVIDSPALNVAPTDRVTIDGHPLPAAEPARLWLYHKPLGLVTSERDEKGRDTVFDNLPEDMPRVMSIGRLDLNSEGLLLLTNDGELKRRLELPSTGWLRKYRVRVKGNPTDPELEPLRKGIKVDGEDFQPMVVILDRHQGANAWLTIGIREGRNREIRRALDSVGLSVNRLIRVSYGPFRLGELEPGAVEEVRPKVLRDQLGHDGATDTGDEPAPRTRQRARPDAPARAAPKPDRHATDLGAPPTSRRGAKIANARSRAEGAGTASTTGPRGEAVRSATTRGTGTARGEAPRKTGGNPASRPNASDDRAEPRKTFASRTGKPATDATSKSRGPRTPRDEDGPRKTTATRAPRATTGSAKPREGDQGGPRTRSVRSDASSERSPKSDAVRARSAKPRPEGNDGRPSTPRPKSPRATAPRPGGGKPRKP
ncbi:MAG: pseudouridine synthase [Gemmobacter sp.]|nr:pseudouridine synthase [Gemmobacter sp.]